MRILALDPGMTTGWAYLSNSNPLKIGTVKHAEFEDWLIQFFKLEHVDILVVEDFIFRPGFKENKWKTTEVPKLIGNAQTVAKMAEIPIELQQPSIKPVGYGMAGMPYKKGKQGTHKEDAIAHGVYYWMTKGRFANGS